MGLTRKVADASGIGYGVNLFEIAPPQQISGVGTGVAAIVGDFPWGPINDIQTVGTYAEFFSLFCPEPFNAKDGYDALKALLNKRFPAAIKVVRIEASGQAKATSGAITAGTGTITVQAKYKGATGNSISYQFTAATNGDGAKRDLVISVGTYSVRHKDLSTTTVDAVSDPYVDVTKSSPSAMPTAMGSPVFLASGSDGTAAAGDYDTAINLFADEGSEADFNVLFVAEAPVSLVGAINDALLTFVQTYDKGMVILSSEDGAPSPDTKDEAVTHNDDRVVCVWPRVKTTNGYDPNRAEIQVDGNSFAAVAILNLAPELSPGGASGRPFLNGITGLADSASRVIYDDLRANGVAAFMMTEKGAILYGGVVTDTTSGKTQIFRRRMTDFIMESIGGFAEDYVSKPLDLDLASQRLGPTTQAFNSAVVGFLADLKTRNRINNYSVDPFGGNLQSDIDAGRWYHLSSVKLYSAMDEIVIQSAIGETVQISE